MSFYENAIAIGRFLHPDNEKGRCLLYVPLEESLLISLHENTLALQAGDCLLLQPDTPHTFTAPPETLLCISFSPELLLQSFLPLVSSCPLLMRFFGDCLRRTKSVPYLHFACRQDDVRPLILSMEKEYDSAAPYREEILLCGLAGLMMRLARGSWVYATVAAGDDSGRFQEVVAYLLKNYRFATLENTARHFNYHPNSIAALIHRETGNTFSHLLRSIRLKQAALLLTQSPLSVEEVALRCGYSHLGHFYKIFKEAYGVTPKTYALSRHADAR